MSVYYKRKTNTADIQLARRTSFGAYYSGWQSRNERDADYRLDPAIRT
jgi:hypothetical protein